MMHTHPVSLGTRTARQREPSPSRLDILRSEDEVVSLCWDRDRGTCSLRLTTLAVDERALLDDTFRLERQRAGAWFLPDTAKVQGSLIQLPFVLRHHPRFATIITADANTSMALGDAPDVVYIWRASRSP
jgi:hypothetical protein